MSNKLVENTIIQGDVLEVLRKQIPDNSIDCIVTSPPYNKKPTNGKAWKYCNIKYGDYGDNLPEPQYQEWQKEILRECVRVIKPSGSIFYNHKQRIQNNNTIFPHEWLKEFVVRQMIIWDRINSPIIAPVRFLPKTEYIFWITKTPTTPKFNANFFSCGDIWTILPRIDLEHPATFPEELGRRCVLATTTENDIVLDPFMGSGTTAIVAIKHNRKFIGIELNQNYIDIAMKRIKSCRQQQKLLSFSQ